jgi:hypothetical protein
MGFTGAFGHVPAVPLASQHKHDRDEIIFSHMGSMTDFLLMS